MPTATLDLAGDGRSPRLAWLAEALQSAVDAQRGRGLLWCAPALAAGAGLYFALSEEPGQLLTLAVATLALLLLWLGRTAPLALLAGALALGFALASFQAQRAAGPMLTASTPEVTVVGLVESIETTSPARLVMVLAPDSIETIGADRLPRALRLSLLKRQGVPAVGTRISFKARLATLPVPVEPGGFDYGRSLWLDGIGGTGRVTSTVVTLADGPRALLPVDSWLADVRAAMGARIRAALAEPYASFAEALITGERSSIPPQINKSLLISGLYHILSISGLHMWLAAGGVFWVLRAGLALFPGLALRYPIRRWAAAAALLMGLFYMLLANGGAATARSFIMVAIVFFAIIVERPAVSIRNLALAAVILLLVDPQAAIEASFQMSFLAVLGLVAFYEAWAHYRAGQGPADPRPRHWSLRLAAWAGAAFTASLATSFIAGFSSSLPAAYHFGRISPYGVLANGLAVPVIGALVMPFALLAAVLMPLGLEYWPLLVMGKGLQLVMMISDFVASLPGANEMIARPWEPAILVTVSGLVVLCLLSGPVRLAGLAIMAVGGALMLAEPPQPDLLVEARGQNVALRNSTGQLVPAQPRRARFAVEKWLQATGDEASLGEAAKRSGWSCLGARCEATVKGRRIVYLSGGEGGFVDCRGADVVIAAFPLRGACRHARLRIDRFDLWRRGAYAVYLSEPDILVRTARGEQGRRPWVVAPQPRHTGN